MKKEQNLNEAQTPQMNIGVIMRSFLEEMAKKHKCPIDQVVVGIIDNEINVWRYVEGFLVEWEQLEVLKV